MKKQLCMFLSVAMLLSLSACSQNTESETAGTTQAASETTAKETETETTGTAQTGSDYCL